MWSICKYFEITAIITTLICKSRQAYVILLSMQVWGRSGLSAREVGATASPAGRQRLQDPRLFWKVTFSL